MLEQGDRPAGVRLAFQVAPGSDLGELSARLAKAGIKSERRNDISPGIAQAVVFTDPKGTAIELFSDYAFAKDDGNDTGVMPLKLGHVAYRVARRAGDGEVLLRRAGLPGVGLARRLLRLPALQPRSPHLNLLHADKRQLHHIAFEVRD